MRLLRGDAYACCSCNVGCPCASGGLETAGSDGCCAVQILEVHTGEIDGTDLAGAIVAAAVDWPAAMMEGNGRGRLYFDERTSPDQRAALDALINGSLGGSFSRIPELVPTFLPAIVTRIDKVTRGDVTVISAGEFGEAVVRSMPATNGELPRLRGVGGFRDDVLLATGDGSWWRDPGLRPWKGGGYAEHSDVEWRG